MTKVHIEKDGNFIKIISIEGHSGYSMSGSDIVCSAISGAVEVVIRLLEKDDNNSFCDIDKERATIQIRIKQPNQFTNDCLSSLYDFLKDLSLEYGKFLKIY